MNIVRLALIFSLLLSNVNLYAGETASFLKIGVGARPIAMGSAFTAIADDINAIAWNPAGLASLKRAEFGAMHAQMYANTRYDFLGFAYPTALGTWALGANFLSQGSLDGRDANGRKSGSFDASDTAISAAYAHRFTLSTKFGATIKYIKSNIADSAATAFAIDLGGMYDLKRMTGRPMTLGFSIQNLGQGMRFLDESNPLPLTFAAGLGYRLPVGLILAMDIKHRPYAKTTEVNIGTEYAILSALTLRMGYASSSVPFGLSSGKKSGLSALGGIAGLGAGLGFKVGDYTLDYSFTPFGELGDVQRISLGSKF